MTDQMEILLLVSADDDSGALYLYNGKMSLLL